jgi:isoquinoline 1-oxidoreductase alpha subunit
MIEFTINGGPVRVDVPPDTPLLWVIREHLKLTGTKFGCGIAQCGACTVHLDGEPVRACSVAMGTVAGRAVTTIEGLSPDASHPLQKAWIAEQVPQCGYCQSGQIMQAAALLAHVPKPDRAQIVAYMDGNICRCATYGRIIKAIQRAAANS